MKRRTLVGGVAASIGSMIGTSLLGFLSLVSTVSGDEPTLSPGEKATLSIKVWVVHSLRFERLPDEDTAIIEINDANLYPHPQSVAESYPPIWKWLPLRLSVIVDVPIQIPPDATPGEYQFAVSVSPTDDITSNVTTKDFTITVVEKE